MSTRLFVLLCAALALMPGTAAAESPAGSGYYLRSYSEITSTPAAQPWWSMTLDLVVKLGLVIGLIYLTSWALRKYLGGSQSANRPAGRVAVLDATALAPNRMVYVVEVANRVLVLGSTATTLATLAEITEPAAIELLKKGASVDEESSTFADQLLSLTRQSSFLQDKIGDLRALAGRFQRAAE